MLKKLTKQRIQYEKFPAFEIRNEKLDAFFRKYLSQNCEYSALWKVMIFVFTLSHGKAQIERGFEHKF